MAKTPIILFQAFLLEKPEEALLATGEYVRDPKVDPKIVVGPVYVFAPSIEFARIKATKDHADAIKDIDSNRLSVVIVPLAEIN